jgi:hypothetical protein
LPRTASGAKRPYSTSAKLSLSVELEAHPPQHAVLVELDVRVGGRGPAVLQRLSTAEDRRRAIHLHLGACEDDAPGAAHRLDQRVVGSRERARLGELDVVCNHPRARLREAFDHMSVAAAVERDRHVRVGIQRPLVHGDDHHIVRRVGRPAHVEADVHRAQLLLAEHAARLQQRPDRYRGDHGDENPFHTAPSRMATRNSDSTW